MNHIVRALYDKIKDATGATLYYGNAPRPSRNPDADDDAKNLLPYIVFSPVDDVPRHLQSELPISFSTWDFKIWAKSATDVGEIYEALLCMLDDADDSFRTDNCFIGFLRGRGFPLMSEENRPNEIVYSRVVECEIITDNLPTVCITFDPTSLGNGEDTTATFTWSQIVSDFDDDDITLITDPEDMDLPVDSMKGTFTEVDGKTYTSVITSPSSGSGMIGVTVRKNAVTLGNVEYSQSISYS